MQALPLVPSPVVKLVEPMLVVDDSPSMRTILRRLLGTIGVNDVTEAASAAEAFTLLKRETFRFVISDVEMEGGSGLDLVRVMQHSESLAAIPVLLVTARLNPDYVAAAKSSQAAGFLLKPFSAETLERKMADLAVWRPAPRKPENESAASQRADAAPGKVTRWTSR